MSRRRQTPAPFPVSLPERGSGNAQQAPPLLQFFAAGSVLSQQRHGTRSRRLGIMLKRVTCLGFSAAMMIAANPPGAARALWDGCYDRPCHYTCYRSHCYPRSSSYGYYRWRDEAPRYRSEVPHFHEAPHVHYHYTTEHPHYHYYDYPRSDYIRYGRSYDPYDGSYYRYYSDYRSDDRYYGYDW
jgi:hypothetical protein